MDVFNYKGCIVKIVEGEHQHKTVYYITVDGRSLTFVSRSDTAKRIACQFIDVVMDDGYLFSKKAGQKAPMDH